MWCAFSTRTQIRRSSYHNVVRVRDVCALFDARAIQTYVINGARVAFLNARPTARGKNGAQTSGDEKKPTLNETRRNANAANHSRRSSCRRCARSLQSETSRYCSIACKAAVAGAGMAPSEEAAREAQAESARAGGERPVERGEKKETRERSGGRGGAARGAAAGSNGEGKKRTGTVEDVRFGDGSNVGSPSPRTPSAVLGTRAATGSGSSVSTFGAARRAKREPSSERFGAPNDVSVSPYTNATASASPRPGARKRQKRAETDSLPGFPDLETLVGGAETRPEEAARGRRNNPDAAPVKKEKVFPNATRGPGPVAEKAPPAVVSNSRRKNRPKRSPDA